MAAAEHDTEHGFGTGLRAQLERRRESEETPAEPAVTDAPEPLPVAEVVDLPDHAPAELDALRRDISEALTREQEARAELADLRGRLEQDVSAVQALSLRSAEVDQRAARLAAHQAELEKREHERLQKLQHPKSNDLADKDEDIGLKEFITITLKWMIDVIRSKRWRTWK